MSTLTKHFRTYVLLVSLMTVFVVGCGGAIVPTAQPTVLPTTAPTAAPVAAPIAAPVPTAALPTATPSATPYAPMIDPANFVAGINHPYLPLIPGVTRTYEVKIAEGTERIEVTTLDETRVIMGVTTMVVRDTAYVEGQVIEATFDWFAQDKDGNVWYFGEDVDNYENGVVVNHNGSWEAGVDGALPGIIMHANPADHVGEPYHQELYVGQAEDMAQVLATAESVTVPFGSFENGVKTLDWTPLEPGKIAHKYYVKDVGFVLEVKVEGASDRLELVNVVSAPITNEQLPQPTSGFPAGIAPESARVDIAKPTFSNPGSITNPLLPITDMDQIIQIGLKDGKPHRTEFTLLPETKTITWNGEQTETRVLQFVAYLDGRVLEHALDFLAQADGGAVWYFGEDVYNYENGVVADRDGTWLAGKDGPPAMIMPANPQVGNVYRVENIPGKVFEEVKVEAINQTLEGPRGLIKGVMFVQQIGMDGKTTIKAFAPGYGEFLAHTEDAAVAVPIDMLAESLSAELGTLLNGANSIFDAATDENWDAHSATLATLTEAWNAHQGAVDLGSLFPLLDIQMARALESLASALEQRDPAATRDAAFDVAIATLDLQMPYRARTALDLSRFDLWTRRTSADSATANPGHVAGDITILEFIWQRVGDTVDPVTAQAIDAQLVILRAAADAEDLAAASDAAAQLGELFAAIKPAN